MSKKTRDKKKINEDTIIVNVNIGNDVEAQTLKKVKLDPVGFVVNKQDKENIDKFASSNPDKNYPEYPEVNNQEDNFVNNNGIIEDEPIELKHINQPTVHPTIRTMSINDLKKVPEEERIIDDGEESVVQTVLEMCKKFGVVKTIACLQKIENNNPNTKTGLKAARIKNYLYSKLKKKY